MVRLSRYTHTFDLGDSVALYHSLRMKPVYLKKEAYEGLQAWLVGPFRNDYSDAPQELKATGVFFRLCGYRRWTNCNCAKRSGWYMSWLFA